MLPSQTRLEITGGKIAHGRPAILLKLPESLTAQLLANPDLSLRVLVDPKDPLQKVTPAFTRLMTLYRN